MNMMDLGLPQIPKMQVPKLRNNDVEVVLYLDCNGSPEKVTMDIPCEKFQAIINMNLVEFDGNEYQILISKYDVSNDTFVLILGGF